MILGMTTLARTVHHTLKGRQKGEKRTSTSVMWHVVAVSVVVVFSEAVSVVAVSVAVSEAVSVV